MLRISSSKRAGSLVVQAEGQLSGQWVEELRLVCERALSSGAALELKLDEVTYADPAGVLLLGELRQREVTIRGCSPFLEEQVRRGVGS